MDDHHRFCWHGVVSTDPGRAAAFYSGVLGWKLVDIRIGRGASPAFEANGSPVAHLKQAYPGEPSHWECFLRVDNVDGRASLADLHGGRVLMRPAEMAAGRVSAVASPSGARLYMLGEIDPSFSHHVGGPGGVDWVDLHSTDLEGDLAWLMTAFRFETGPRTAGTYALLSYKGQARAGAMQARLPLPSMWLAWIAVNDLDAIVKKVEQHKGSVLSPPIDTGGGRWSVLADGTGTVFGVIERKRSSS